MTITTVVAGGFPAINPTLRVTQKAENMGVKMFRKTALKSLDGYAYTGTPALWVKEKTSGRILILHCNKDV